MPVIDEFRLEGRIALVAGDSGGYLPVLAEAMAEAGAHVLVMANSPRAVEEALTGARKWTQEALGTVADMTSPQEVDQALSRLMAQRKRVDILVNSFRTEHARPLAEVTPEEWDEVIKRTVRPVFLLCRAVGRAMVEQGYGRVVNITSNLAERGMANSAAFCAAHGAVLQLTRALAQEWARQNVRVNAIGIGWFSSQEVASEEEQKELLVRYIPLRRKGHPRDITPLLVYLASDSCDYTTGQPVYVDGGLMARP